ncbi:hypothetical protein A7318_28080 (plasmid) [Pseudomonas lurida]|uniref:ATP-binding protein n=1 Tax=Pseudomonas lurida TaxID=244566 RepID=UPI00083D2194|nr:transporter substrate-binding domain-containing protein [Pseudomonas lurida]AOE82505.1 hypothetical protein A7318_28080 [Pseudomonas lurida]
MFYQKQLVIIIINIFLVLPICEKTNAKSQYISLILLGRSEVNGFGVQINNIDKEWLRNKGSIVLGVSSQDIAPPFDLGLATPEYEGLIADYAGLISKLLNIPITVRRYSNNLEKISALENGEVDIISSTSSEIKAKIKISETQPYLEDRQTLVSRGNPDNMLANKLSGKKIAIVEGYSTSEVYKKTYDQAQYTFYSSAQTAIAAVAFGKEDAYIGEAVKANYLTNKNYADELQSLLLPAVNKKHFSFSILSSNKTLLRLINNALETIPSVERSNILQRWSAGGENISSFLEFSRRLNKTESEWLEKNPKIKVLVLNNDAPVSFLDKNKRFRGVTADVLDKISIITGLRFEPVYIDNANDSFQYLKQNNIDVIAVFEKSQLRSKNMIFTRPYMIEPMVLATQKDNESVNSLESLTEKTVAVVRESAANEFLSSRDSEVNINYGSNEDDILSQLKSGNVDGIIGPLHSIRKKINGKYSGELKVVGAVDKLWMQFAFATLLESSELCSILDKALLSISPKEMDELTARWQGDVEVDDDFWSRNKKKIIEYLSLGSIGILTLLTWLGYLMWQISKRREAEHALHDQMIFMRLVIDGTPHPIYVRDTESRLLICNEKYLDIVRIDRDQVIGRKINDILFDRHSAIKLQKIYHLALKSGTSVAQDRMLVLNSGETLNVYHWVLPYKNKDGNVAGIICGWMDIGERQTLLKQLREAKEDAELANKAKTTFLATMSHEIRTPMNAVIGILEMLLKSNKMNPADLLSLEVAAGAALDLQNLVGDILDVARIESGRFSLSDEKFRLREVIDSVVRVHTNSAAQKKLDLKYFFSDELDQVVLGDPLRIKQIVSNLLSNAVKFTSEGYVSIKVKSTKKDINEVNMLIEISDTGIGIADDDQVKLFSPFAQASNNDKDSRSGSGLGLFISKNLCELMGGYLTLNSSVGNGTKAVFYLKLPAICTLNDGLDIKETQKLISSKNILVVDDYPANRLLLMQQLSYLGHKVTCAENGAQAYQCWLDNKFEIVITDLNMPIMNGEELARKIRRHEEKTSNEACCILAYTANARLEERLRCFEAGMNECMFKPLRLSDLINYVGRATDNNQQGFLTNSFKINTITDAGEDIDLSSIIKISQGDPESITSLMQALLDSTVEDIRKINMLNVEKDFILISEYSHKVKGGARIINACALIACCDKVQIACEAENSSAVAVNLSVMVHEMSNLQFKLEKRLMIKRLE